MIICFRCTESTKRTMDRLVDGGGYGDYCALIHAAVANLATLHEEFGDANSLVLGQPGQGGHGRASAGEPPSGLAMGIPHLFRSDGLVRPRVLADLPADRWRSAEPVPLEEWIFGQYNRLLPAKANCRALGHLLAEAPEGVPASEVAERIAKEAANLGEYLRRHDEQHGLGRDRRLATAFPKPGRENEKSRARYADQFVAYVDSKSRVHGLLIDYKLVNQTDEEEPRLLLTEAGWQLAVLPNPALDGGNSDPSSKFSQQEADFLLAHIRQHVPREDFAHRAILATLAEGHDTPDALDAALRAYVSDEVREGQKDSFFSLQRSGALCRMLDLGVVARNRAGLRVSYTQGGSGEFAGG